MDLLLALISTLSLEEVQHITPEDEAWYAYASDEYRAELELESGAARVETTIVEDCLLPAIGCPEVPESAWPAQMHIGTTNIRSADGVVGRVYTTPPNNVTPYWVERWVIFEPEMVERVYQDELYAEYDAFNLHGWAETVGESADGNPAVEDYTAAIMTFRYFTLPSASIAATATFSSFSVIDTALFRVENTTLLGTPKDSVEEGWLYRMQVENLLTGDVEWMDHWVLKDDYLPPGTSLYSMHLQKVSNPYSSLQDFLASQVSAENFMSPTVRWQYAPIVYAFGELPLAAH